MKALRTTLVAVAFLSAAAVPATAFAQIAVGARAGTLGLGAEASAALGEHLAIRGGIGALPVEFEGTFSDFNYRVQPPSMIWSLGVDVYLGRGDFRLGAGVLHRPRYLLSGSQTGTTQIANQTYSGTIRINGFMQNEHETAPYVMLGFGGTAAPGVGGFADIGAAFVGAANIELTGSCTLSSGQPCPGNFQNDINEEAAQAEQDVGRFLKVHPILQFGMRIGLGF